MDLNAHLACKLWTTISRQQNVHTAIGKSYIPVLLISLHSLGSWPTNNFDKPCTFRCRHNAIHYYNIQQADHTSGFKPLWGIPYLASMRHGVSMMMIGRWGRTLLQRYRTYMYNSDFDKNWCCQDMPQNILLWIQIHICTSLNRSPPVQYNGLSPVRRQAVILATLPCFIHKRIHTCIHTHIRPNTCR